MINAELDKGNIHPFFLKMLLVVFFSSFSVSSVVTDDG